MYVADTELECPVTELNIHLFVCLLPRVKYAFNKPHVVVRLCLSLPRLCSLKYIRPRSIGTAYLGIDGL